MAGPEIERRYFGRFDDDLPRADVEALARKLM